ncbi:phosphopantetheinyl transferase [Methylacidiphilum kamchatkense Kam1]|uniref:Holo-[acyl-carrier-protein] synthase n=1 Tax=Methylacidiphilum kamchatkense Kam1 TaxID=1202785 RepID=A0A0C1V6E9_9BACT|nr:holo-ACP synthase [Methylacidiphilum kamchatkense]KIE59275.1 phosphopantetheinyl transferase [Methylacidiphilum kamchatkense Kam1]QDQ42764.1 holo-[acyl-carrier protein] synthase [Methylacidiphilum kamchatkense Kam1]
MDIIAVGIDLVENSRIESVLSRFGDRFLKKIYRESELAYCFSMANPIPHLSVRFAAKEAAIKALGSPIAYWKDIEVLAKKNRAPQLFFHGEVLKLSSSKGVSSTYISLSHCRSTSAAVVILTG